jgi:predicted nucleic acid-binding protein
MDDASGRSVSEALGLDTKGTVYVLLKAHRKGLLTKEETRALLARLIQVGFSTCERETHTL